MPSISAPGYPVIYPVLMVGHEFQIAGRNIVHDTIDPDQENQYLSLRAAGPRTGTLGLLFGNQDKANECIQLHSRGLVLTAHDDGVHIADMNYVLEGSLGVVQSESRNSWLVTVGFRALA